MRFHRVPYYPILGNYNGDNMSIKMLRDKILVAENKAASSTSSGIIIEGGVGESKTAKVLAVGPDVKNVREGHDIYLNWSKGQIVRIDGEQRVIVAEEDVAAIKN
jgi:co-chaperonin GroES (HSP10)